MNAYGSKLVSECINRVANGETIADIARDTGVSDSAICNWCKSAGVKSVKSYRKRTAEELAHASELWANGATAREIANELGMTETSVNSMTYKHRDLFPARNRGGPRFTKERIRALERENERLRELLRKNGIEEV